jgi:hypothetical protein
MANSIFPGEIGYLERAVSTMTEQGVRFAPGLSDEELTEVERLYALRIPPDLKSLLQFAVPLGAKFPDWRGPRTQMRSLLSRPLEGILFDAEHNDFWAPSWGPRPAKLSDALATAREVVATAPILIPVYMHRYVPAEPEAPGNPVLSVYQTDIIQYGDDLPSYLWREFKVPMPSRTVKVPRGIRFWDELIRLNEERA